MIKKSWIQKFSIGTTTEISKHEWDEWIQPYIDCNEAVLHDTGMLYKD